MWLALYSDWPKKIKLGQLKLIIQSFINMLSVFSQLEFIGLDIMFCYTKALMYYTEQDCCNFCFKWTKSLKIDIMKMTVVTSIF